jgi:hypothetical protein
MGGDIECELLEKGRPIFAYAERSEHAGALISEAIDVGADTSVRMSDGDTVLARFLQKRYGSIAAARSLNFVGPETDRVLVARLLDMGIDDGAIRVSSDRNIRLRLAVVFGAKETLREEVDRLGLTTSISGTSDHPGPLTLLQAAAIANSPNAIYELHALGADVNARGRAKKETPLMIAVDNNCIGAVAALIECGADTTVKIKVYDRELSLLAYAVESKYALVAKMLRSANSGREIVQALDAGVIGTDVSPAAPSKSKSLEAL